MPPNPPDYRRPATRPRDYGEGVPMVQLSGDVGELRGNVTGIIERQGRAEHTMSVLAEKVDTIDEKIDALTALVNQGRGAFLFGGYAAKATHGAWAAVCFVILAVWTLSEKFHWFGM